MYIVPTVGLGLMDLAELISYIRYTHGLGEAGTVDVPKWMFLELAEMWLDEECREELDPPHPRVVPEI